MECLPDFWTDTSSWYPAAVSRQSRPSVGPAGSGLSLAVLLGPVSPWLPLPATPGPLPALGHDMPVVLAESCRFPGLGDIPSKIKLSHLGSVQRASVLQLLTAFFILLHPGVINGGVLSYFMFNYRTQAATLIEVVLTVTHACSNCQADFRGLRHSAAIYV